MFPLAEYVAEGTQLASPDETSSIFADVAFEPVVAVAVVEEVKILCGVFV